MTDQHDQSNQSGTETDSDAQRTQTPYSALLQTNTLLSDDVPVENARAVLALLGYLDLSDESPGEEGNYGLYLIHEWLRRSLAFKGKADELATPLSTQNQNR